VETVIEPTDSPTDAPAAAEPAEAVFIVGVSRSGTTLLRRVLDRHPLIGIATENHYLGHLLPWEGARHYFRRVGDLQQDQAVRDLVDLIYSGGFQRRSRLREVSPYWRWLTTKVPRKDIETRLLESDRSERGVFEAFLRIYADRRGKTIIGEKTPAHLDYVETLLEWFPNGRIVHMIRDPRAIYVSEARRRAERGTTAPFRWLVRIGPIMRAFIFVQVVWVWARALGRHRVLKRRYPDRYLGIRFEDLVADPESTVERICAHLGVKSDPRMFEQKVTSKGAMVGEPGFDEGAASRWRERISPSAKALIERLLGRRFSSMGYRD
jgi:hypothetical protein